MAAFENVEVSDELVELGLGIRVPASWTVILHDEPDVPGIVSVRVVFDRALDRTVAEEVSVRRQGAGDEVTSITLREVRVQTAVQVSGLKASSVSVPGEPTVVGGDYLLRMPTRQDRSLSESVVDAARAYRLAAALNIPPLRTVADGLGVSQSTATRLMNRARMEGLAPGVNLPDPFASGPVVGPPASGGPSIG